MTTREIRVVIPTGFGINCEAETAQAFTLAGARPRLIHLNDLVTDPSALAHASILALAGGFSFGDHLGAGRALANRLRCRLAAHLETFIGDGGLVIGICNGFQTMVRLGLLPGGGGKQTATLGPNRRGLFHDGWVRLAFDRQSPCVFTRGLEAMDLPVRHGEGRLLTLPAGRELIAREHLAACRYANPKTNEPTDVFPHDPNGSEDQIAGLCDPSGRLFGLMPNPEAFLYPENHPDWRRSGAPSLTGLTLFENAISACRGR